MWVFNTSLGRMFWDVRFELEDGGAWPRLLPWAGFARGCGYGRLGEERRVYTLFPHARKFMRNNAVRQGELAPLVSVADYRLRWLLHWGQQNVQVCRRRKCFKRGGDTCSVILMICVCITIHCH